MGGFPNQKRKIVHHIHIGRNLGKDLSMLLLANLTPFMQKPHTKWQKH